MEHIIRLVDYNVYNSYDQARDNNDNTDTNSFVVQMFGIDEGGKTYSVTVDGFKPFFYVRVPDNWKIENKEAFIKHLKEKLGKYYANSIISAKLVKKRTLYGFDNKKEHKFIFIEFANINVFNKTKNLWYSDYTSGHNLLKGGYKYKDENGDSSILLYEANIPPLLRFFHIKNISPSGWIAIPKKKVFVKQETARTVNCDYELTTNIKNIIALNEKEDRVPYKIMSFDIEASSSHGDFPIPIKTYKKLATNIVDYFEENSNVSYTKISIREILMRIILTAFTYDTINNIDIVYPKIKPNKSTLENLCEKWINYKIKHTATNSELNEMNCIESMFERMSKELEEQVEVDAVANTDADEETGENNCEEGFFEALKKKAPFTFSSQYKKENNTTILDILLDKNVEREYKIQEVNNSLTLIFPKLEGDKVTFIGSTIMNYGNKEPHLNHCIVLNTCSTLPSENTLIETYSTEKDVLLAWQKFVQKENPDIIIGYNIFGFDYEFMFRRAIENNCVEEFLKLGRNTEEICGTRDKESDKWKIEESSIQLASGQHDLRYIKMNGRLQVDLYNFYRRAENLASYKLDHVAGHFIGDYIKKYTVEDGTTIITSSNLTGLNVGSYIHIEVIGHTINYYENGKKFPVCEIDKANGIIKIEGILTLDLNNKNRWCLAKDDVTPKDIFRMANGSDDDRAIIAKYCIQDCNLVHYLFNKSDILTGYIEMAKICSVPINFLVMRGQGIKLQSLIAKECRDINTLIPVIEKGGLDEGYEGATVLPPKCDLYLDNPIACNDYASLYPSSMISENLSHDTKVWTQEFDLAGNMIEEWGYKDNNNNYIYDNIEGYEYVNVQYDTYKYVRTTPKTAAKKIKVGYKICRYVQFPNGESGIMPAILKKLLKARKDTRKMIPNQSDEFMKQVLEQRQLGYKVTANSLYGGCGAKTSSFYEIDIAACTTAMGRKFLTYGKRIIEECYGNRICDTKCYGKVITNAEYIYGDTDSVFYTFNLKDLDGNDIRGKKALEITIELAQEVGKLSALFLKEPHDFEYEKTFMPFCLLSKKRYVGMLYEDDINKCKRKEMGIVLKRRDNAPIVKDIYGGIIDILMKQGTITNAIEFLKNCLQNVVNEKYPLDKLIISKSLRSGYKNPKSIAHKVLSDRITARDPGNKPCSGDRIEFAYVVIPNKKALQGEKIETPTFIRENKLKIDYPFYITNQIMKPVQQVFALVLEKIWLLQKKPMCLLKYKKNVETLKKKYFDDEDKLADKIDELRCKEIKVILFDEYIRTANNTKTGNQSISQFFGNK